MIYRVEENNISDFMNAHHFKTATVYKDGKFWVVDGMHDGEETTNSENKFESNKKCN